MDNTIRLFRLVHKVALSTLLLLVATIPLIIEINIVTTLVVLPLFLVLTFLLSILVEQKLTTLSLHKTKIKKTNQCIIKNCLHKKCFG